MSEKPSYAHALEPFEMSKLSYQQFIGNMTSDRGNRSIAYIPPGNDHFMRVDNDSSFQTAVMRMRGARYGDIVFYDVTESREWSRSVMCIIMCRTDRNQVCIPAPLTAGQRRTTNGFEAPIHFECDKCCGVMVERIWSHGFRISGKLLLQRII